MAGFKHNLTVAGPTHRPLTHQSQIFLSDVIDMITRFRMIKCIAKMMQYMVSINCFHCMCTLLGNSLSCLCSIHHDWEFFKLAHCPNQWANLYDIKDRTYHYIDVLHWEQTHWWKLARNSQHYLRYVQCLLCLCSWFNRSCYSLKDSSSIVEILHVIIMSFNISHSTDSLTTDQKFCHILLQNHGCIL